MADTLNSSICSAHNFVDNYGKNEVSNCAKCSDYENQLQEALDELSSLKLVNKLLQKEALAYTSHKRSWKTDEDPVDRIGDSVEYNGWSLITEKS
jgi:PHD/YefM family antitoxin component YafN of YafNO toxin-antitoxin module